MGRVVGISGWHLEFGESWEACAKRETQEETGVRTTNIRFGAVTNDIFSVEKKHYIALYMVTDWQSEEAKVLEPEKCERWERFSWDQLPGPLFLPIENLKKTTFDPFETLTS